MVVAAGREKKRARIATRGDVEAKPTLVKASGLVEIADVQVHMPHRGAGWRTLPLTACTRADQIVDVERIGGHLELAATVTPLAARPVRVDLDAEGVGIPQVDRLTHEV